MVSILTAVIKTTLLTHSSVCRNKDVRYCTLCLVMVGMKPNYQKLHLPHLSNLQRKKPQFDENFTQITVSINRLPKPSGQSCENTVARQLQSMNIEYKLDNK